MKKWIMGVILLFVFVSGGFYIQHIRSQEEGVLIKAEDIVSQDEIEATRTRVVFQENEAQINEVQEISGYIHVTGAVKNPGVYPCSEGMRAFQVIDLAGGLLEDADETKVNLARVVNDGEQIYIPKMGEDYEESTSMSTDNITAKVNINTASITELTTLTGIGEARAKAIIEYREANQGFKTIEDIMQVTGIKMAMFEKIKENIVVR